MKKALIVLLILCNVFLLSCEGILTSFEFAFTGREEFFAEQQKAIALGENFCFALSDDDIQTAESYLHPDSPLCNDALPISVLLIELVNEVDFSRGVAFSDRELGTSYANLQNLEGYHQGYCYCFTLKVVIEGKIIKLYFEVVSNEKGFGIYTFEKYNNT